MASILQQTAYVRSFILVLDSDGRTGATGKTPTVTLSKAGGTPSAAQGVVEEVGTGWYKITLTTTDTNTPGDLSYHVTATDCDDTDFTDQVLTQAQADGVAIGTTGTYAPTRNDLIEMALKKIRVLSEGEVPNADQLADGIRVLNMLIGEEDASDRHIWTLDSTPALVLLVADQQVYSPETASTVDHGFPSNLRELVMATYRDETGYDTPLDVVTREQFERIGDKYDQGDPQQVCVAVDRTLASQSLHVWPLPNNVGTASLVYGTDANRYHCIKAHTAATTNQPITGAAWRTYWKQTGTGVVAGTDTWTSGTDYTTAKHLRLWYRRPLFDFTAANDNPDIPRGYYRMLLHKLARDLSVDYGQEKLHPLLDTEGIKSELRVFPHVNKERTTDQINKAKYY